MIGKRILYILILFLVCRLSAQQSIVIEANLDAEAGEIRISQDVLFTNPSDRNLSEIYFFDWVNSFSSKTTPLAQRFAENFSSSFHFEKDVDRGHTTIHTIKSNGEDLVWDRPSDADILRIKLIEPLAPNESGNFQINYTIKIPDAKFTRYGVTREHDFYLKNWLILPAIFDGEWQVYSNKNIDNPYILPTNFKIDFGVPKNYELVSDFNYEEVSGKPERKLYRLQGEKRLDATIYIEQQRSFQTIQSDYVELVTSLNPPKVPTPLRIVFIERVLDFLENQLGAYPFDRMVISDAEYRRDPVYGLNLLPSFLSPFPDGFEYDLALLKTVTKQYLENTLGFNPRTDYWLIDALQIYLMMNYVETNYPNTKIGGSLSDWWILQWSHASTLKFNDQYQFVYQNIARKNLQQPLTMERDSLLKFNVNLANAYRGGSGLKYMGDFIGNSDLDDAIRYFYENQKTQLTSTEAFRTVLKKFTTSDTDWFFDEYIRSGKPIDFRITEINKRHDLLEVYIQSENHENLPVSVFGLGKDGVLFKRWAIPKAGDLTLTVPAEGVERIAVNHDEIIPEINKRNNYKAVSKLFNKPFQPRLFRDVEDPKYNQLFFIPVFDYNLYDGLALGIDAHNKNILNKNLEYSLHPLYGFRSKTIIGGGNAHYTHYPDEGKLFSVRYGFSGKYFSYNYDHFYRRFSPYLTLTFRPKDLRQNERQYINLRTVSVHRDQNAQFKLISPNYDVFNFQYVYSDQNLIDFFKTVVDYQISSHFSKLSFQLEYRKLFINNRQLNLRLFSGIFLFNDSRHDDDFFSFALDRPSDYMYDYKYYGRSETEGLFSQQLIIAEGGFKSKLEPQFANSWMTTLNVSTSIWRWIYAYGDAGIVHNRDRATKAVFDSGIRLSLVADYFELYFPVYSSIGFEPAQDNYQQNIRFIVTLSPETLFKLFTRRWY